MLLIQVRRQFHENMTANLNTLLVYIVQRGINRESTKIERRISREEAT
jgi:hypothetical protein